jgi:hypothetical protein
MGGQAEQRRDRAAFPETTETRLKDVFEAFEKLERELLQHIEQLRLAGWLGAGGECELAADLAEYKPPECNEDTSNTRYLLR